MSKIELELTSINLSEKDIVRDNSFNNDLVMGYSIGFNISRYTNVNEF